MSQRIYIAASFEQKDQVRTLLEELKAAGHTITADWTVHKEIAGLNSNGERQALRRQYAIEDTEGVASATVYALLIGDRKSTGAHIELGIALGAHVPHIFLIGHPGDSQLFYTHPSIKVVPNTKTFIEIVNSL
jgi:hypothetical protein